MENFIDTENMLTLDGLKNSNYDDKEELLTLAGQVETYLSNQWWCKNIRQIYFNQGLGEIISIFYAEFEPDGITNNKVWVLLGELPPSHIEAVTCCTWIDALHAYVCRAEGWVYAMRNGETIPGINLSPTKEYAAELSVHLNMIREVVLSEFKGNPSRGRD